MSAIGPTVARRPFLSLLLVSLLGASLMLALALSVLPRPLNHIVERCTGDGGCMALVRTGRLWVGPLLLALLPWSIFHGFRKGAGQLRATRRALGCLGRSGEADPHGALHALSSELGLARRIDIVPCTALVALCRGYIRPRIVLSTATLALLTSAELAAVLRHERRHLRGRHPLQLLVARTLAAALPFLPVVRELARILPRAQELAADRTVIQAGQRGALGRALLVMQGAMGDQAAGAPLVLGMSGALDARVDQLVGATGTYIGVSRSALIRTALFFGTGIGFLLLGAVGVPGESALATFLTVPSWPPGYPWHGLLVSTVLCARALECLASIVSLNQGGSTA
jgi:Zn-dependent protease with chaperone function